MHGLFTFGIPHQNNTKTINCVLGNIIELKICLLEHAHGLIQLIVCVSAATQTLRSKDIPKHLFPNNAALSHIMPPHLIMALLHCYSTFEDKPALFQLLKPQSLCEWPGTKVNSQINFDDTQAKTLGSLPIPL